MAEGIEVRHQRDCRSRNGGRCNCNPTYRASVWSPIEERLIRKSFPSKAAAKAWRHDSMTALDRGELRAPSKRTIREAADAWLEAARAGQVRNRSGDPYKPAATRGYDKALRLRVLPRFGNVRLSDLRRIDVQDFVDEMLAEGLAASTIDTTLNPLRAIYRYAIARNEVGTNPTRGLELPAVRSKPKRIAPPEEAERLLAALRDGDKAVWATALYAGLRRGELRALRWECVDLAEGIVRVERGWDDLEGPIDLKTKSGRRRVPIAAILRDYLIDHKMSSGRSEGLVFGQNGQTPFDSGKLTGRADDDWEAAGLERITLHACRHTFASYMIAAGVNAKALSTYMGHANISITLDLYGHLMPGNKSEAAGLLDAFLAAQQKQSDEAARRAGFSRGFSHGEAEPHQKAESTP